MKIACDFWRDVTLREDHCQVRKGEAPRVLAGLNSFLLALLDFLGVSNVPQQMRFFDAHPLQAVRLLLGSLLMPSTIIVEWNERERSKTPFVIVE